jgi:hypothetical protein
VILYRQAVSDGAMFRGLTTKGLMAVAEVTSYHALGRMAWRELIMKFVWAVDGLNIETENHIEHFACWRGSVGEDSFI